jgi:RND family efflux transporter MFP subunit
MNRDIQAARLGLDEANERVSEAWSSVYPTVDLNASYTRNVSPTVNFLPAAIFDPTAGPDDYIGVQFGADNQWTSTVSVEQPLFRPGVFVALGAADRYRSLQTESVRGQTQTVVTRVRMAYYQLLLSQEQVRLVDNSVRRVRESLEETQALNRAGLSSDYDVLRLEVELGNLVPNLRRAENAARQARRQLAVELDIPEQESIRVTGALAEMDLADLENTSPAHLELLAFLGFRGVGLEAVNDALSSASDLRSDLRQMELNEDLRKTEMRLEQVEYLPNITLFGNYIISAQNNGSPSFFAKDVGQRAYSRLVGVRFSIPVFGGFKRDARIDQKRALLRQAETQTRQARDLATSQVKSLVESADEALMRAQGQNRAVTQAHRGYDIASAQYREGLGSQLELTDSEVALRQSEFNYAQAVYDYRSTRRSHGAGASGRRGSGRGRRTVRRGRQMRISVETIEMKRNWMRGGAALLVAASMAACGGAAQADGIEGEEGAGAFVRVINVEVTEVQPQNFVEEIRLTAVALANQDVQISAEESGVIREILVDKGARVSEGQALFRIDDAVLSAQVAQVRAAAELAEETYARRRSLWEEDRMGSEIVYLEARAAAEQTAANLKVLEERQARTVIRAPFEGVLESREVEVGTMVSPGMTVARVVDLNPVKVMAGVPERYASDVSVGTAATVTFDVLDGEGFEARIGYVGTTVERASRTFPIEIVLPNADGRIKPEMVASMSVIRRDLKDVVVVPQDALVRVEGGYVVFAAVEWEQGMVAEVRPVTVGPTQRDMVVIEAGIQSGERLIVVGQKSVADGDRVNIVGTR